MIIQFDPTGLGQPLALQEIEALANGRARVSTRYTRDTPKSYRLNEEERALFEQTKASGVIFTKSDKVAWLADWWLETTGQPCIRVRTRGKLAQVTMDLISCSREDSNMWTGTVDHPKPSAAQSTYAAARDASQKDRHRVLSDFAEDLFGSDEPLALLAEACVSNCLDDVVRWGVSLWKYNGLRYDQISQDSALYEVWSLIGGFSTKRMKKLMGEIIKLLPEVKGESPQWLTPHDGDPDAKQLIVRAGELLDFRTRAAHPASSRLFVRGDGAADLVNALGIAAGAHPRGWHYFGVYTSIEKVPVANASALARDLRALYWDVIGRRPPEPPAPSPRRGQKERKAP